MNIIGMDEVVEVFASTGDRSRARRPTSGFFDAVRRTMTTTTATVTVAVVAMIVGPLQSALPQGEAPRTVVVATQHIPDTPPLTESHDRRSAFDASLARLSARGIDAQAMVQKATTNLRHWQENPAKWDHAHEFKIDVV